MEAIFSLLVLGMIWFGLYILFRALVLFIRQPVSFILLAFGLGFVLGDDECEI
jgi:hypothetical protein